MLYMRMRKDMHVFLIYPPPLAPILTTNLHYYEHADRVGTTSDGHQHKMRVHIIHRGGHTATRRPDTSHRVPHLGSVFRELSSAPRALCRRRAPIAPKNRTTRNAVCWLRRHAQTQTVVKPIRAAIHLEQIEWMTHMKEMILCSLL